MANQRELRIIGMSRSGNHCIINWITRQVHGRFCFLNCAEGKTNPYVTSRPLASGAPFRVNYDGFDIDRERAGMFSVKDYLIHSYEDCFLGYACSDRFEVDHDAFVGRSAQRFDVLVLRDPFNLFASRRKMGVSMPEATALRIWKQHAREFLGGGRYLKHNRIPVSYNAWVTCPRYRREIADRLGLAFSDAGVDEVASCGGGSSFDGLRFDGRARGMPVFERWRHFAADPDYRRLFDRETVRLARQVFGDLPAIGRLPIADRPGHRRRSPAGVEVDASC
jgi:hypothetical protein